MSSPPDRFLAGLDQFRLLDLTTMRSSGRGVTTPVRFGLAHGCVIVSLDTKSHKVARVTANPCVRVAGHQSSETRRATLRMLDGTEATNGYRVLARRYRFLFIQRLLLLRRPTAHVTCEITLDESR